MPRQVAAEGPSPPDPCEAFLSIVDRFLGLEHELGLFERNVRGVAYWPLMRLAAINRVAAKRGFYANTSTLLARKMPAGEKLRRLARFNPLLSTQRRRHVVVRGALQYQAGAASSDLYTDPILGDLPAEETEIVDLNEAGLAVDRMGEIRATSAYALDRVKALAGSVHSRIVPRSAAWQRARAELLEVERRFAAEFDAHVPLASLALANIVHFRAMHFAWRRYFRLRRPSFVILGVQGYGYEGLVRAAHDVGATVVEMQHGTIYRGHLGYHFPGRRSVPDVPDVFLAFGPRWERLAEFPSNMRCGSFGFRALAEARARLRGPEAERRRQVAVLTADPFHAELAVEAARVLAAPPLGLAVTLRPHPADPFDYRAAIAAAGMPGIAFAGPERPVHELLASSEYAVTGFSTTLFEAMYFGCKAIAMPLGYEAFLAPLVAGTKARIVRRVDELAAAVAVAEPPGPMHDYFDDSRPKLLDVLAELRQARP
jgi:hypothetical protein